MNKLATELNDVISGGTAFELLSDFGRRMYFPKGIVLQSAEAKQKANNYNATVGMAISKGQAIELNSLKKLIPELKPAEAVTYAPTGGDPALVKLWKKDIVKKNPAVDPSKISTPIVTSGLTHGISLLMELFVDEGNSVVVPDMFWGNYRLMIEERQKASIAAFPFYTESKGLNVDGFIETIKKTAVNKKAVVIVNFPNNPTGYSPTKTEAAALKEALVAVADEGYKLLVVTDDAYFGLFFEEDTYKHSLFNELYDAHENILAAKVDGTTKEHFVWGFRVGFVTFGSKGMSEEAYKVLETKLSAAIRASISNCSRPAQSLLQKAMQDPNYNSEKEAYEVEIKERYLKIKEILAEHEDDPVLDPLGFNSGYFMSYKMKKGSSEALRKKLLDEEGIGTISIQDKFLRVAFSSVDLENIEDLYAKIYKAASEL
ncbi:MAG: aminotransferase class I/II-fold pyridoxal phosphate-dependent enzyme [Spirochaetales bacterium]|uniref:Aminotransferase class I/II-fold pyridoxal phosphate-dependent enzyme n=1 Tax=Candidatus Thalassospirochaeta sargassi TaxID=3119039 RepID=A0AAJ1IJC2_9SPIO|nr:aminotransferase class I/II-fold pyridoxal phosphate-dependent enzyme [Spirochaetales bacterium]